MWHYLKILFKKLFRRDLSEIELTEAFLQNAVKLSRRGRVEIFQPSFRVLNDKLMESENFVYVIVFKRKMKRPRQIKEWFDKLGGEKGGLK